MTSENRSDVDCVEASGGNGPKKAKQDIIPCSELQEFVKRGILIFNKKLRSS